VPTLKWIPLDDTHARGLSYTPLVTDGRYLYVLSTHRKLPPKKKEGEEEKEIEEEDKTIKIMIEIYDPLDGFKFVKASPFLKKKADSEEYF